MIYRFIIQDDDNITLNRWSQHYSEIKEGTVSDIIKLIKIRDKVRESGYSSAISKVYFYFIVDNESILFGHSTTLQSIIIDIPVKYVERLEFMSENNIDIDIINKLVDECIQKLLEQLELTNKCTFFDIIVPQYGNYITKNPQYSISIKI